MQDIFRDKLSIIANDDLLIKAIKAVFDEEVAKEQNFIQPNDTNILIGEKYRACEKAKQIIENSFAEIVGYQQGKKTNKLFNKER